MNDSQRPGDKPPARAPKRPYRKPKLEIYGELGQITGASGGKGATADGGVMSKLTKTH